MHSDNPEKFCFYLLAALAFMAVLCVYTPRFMAFAPGLIGLGALGAGCFVYGLKAHWPVQGLYIIGGIIFLAGISALWSLDPAFALERTLKIATILLSGTLLIAVIKAVPAEGLRRHALILPAGLSLMTALILIELLCDYPLYRLIRGLPVSEAVDSARMNRSVNIAVACFPAIWAIVLSYGRRWQYGGIIALYAAMLLLTDSQSAQLAFIVALIAVYAFPYSKRYAWLALKAVIAAGIFAAPWLAIWMFDNLAAVVDALPFLGEGSGYGANRMEIWDFVSRYALQNPLYGYGIEATRAVESFDTMQLYQPGTTALHPHNFAVQLWIEFGLIGAVAACVFVGWVLQILSRLPYKQARAALPSFLALLVIASFGYGFWQSWWLGLIMFVWAVNIIVIKIVNVKAAP